MFRVFHEILGDYADIPETPKRIVSLYPSVTESLVQIGSLEELVGVSSHCHLYVKGLKKVSVSSATEVNYKRLEEMKPDLILTTTGIQREVAKALHSKGYHVFPIPVAWSLYGIIANVLLIGALVGREGGGCCRCEPGPHVLPSWIPSGDEGDRYFLADNQKRVGGN